MNRFYRSTLATLAVSLGLVWGTPAAMAQATYPNQPVKIIINFQPGGPADILARSIGQVLTEKLKQPFVVENKPGAGGNIGADAVAKSPADGHTLLLGIDTTFTINPHLYASMAFKPTDLKPVMILASSGLMLGVHPSTGVKTFGDLLALGRKKNLNFSSAGNGTPGHLAAAMLSNSTPIKTTHIPYRGNAPASLAVLTGEVDGGILGTPGMLQHVQNKGITALAVTSAQRSKLAPQLPTVAELGLKALEQEILYLVMAPAATPDAVVQLLQRHILEALNRPDVKARLESLDLVIQGQTGAAAAKQLADLNVRYGAVVRATGMSVQ